MRPFILHFALHDGWSRLPRGGMTIAAMDDGRVGWSLCSPEDNFERKVGLYGDPKRRIPGALGRLSDAPYVVPDYDPDLALPEKVEFLSMIADEILYSRAPRKYWNLELVPRKIPKRPYEYDDESTGFPWRILIHVAIFLWALLGCYLYWLWR